MVSIDQKIESQFKNRQLIMKKINKQKRVANTGQGLKKKNLGVCSSRSIILLSLQREDMRRERESERERTAEKWLQTQRRRFGGRRV